jgi:hypothetical protein
VSLLEQAAASLALCFGQQQHLLSQLFEIGDHPLSFASTGEVAHALVSISRLQVPLEHEVDAV